LLKAGSNGIGQLLGELAKHEALAPRAYAFMTPLSRILSILDIDLHVEEVTGADKTLDVVVDIFNRVNSGGTKLSKGDLALARICASWPEGRETMKDKLAGWSKSGYHFSLDWLLRSVNTVLTGEARFQHLHQKTALEVKDALTRATGHIDTCLTYIDGRLGLDHDDVFFGRFAVPVMARYLDQRQQRGLGKMDEKERDKLLFWYVQAAMWGRFSGSTESYIDQDLEALDGEGGGLDRLLEQLRLWHGGLRVEPGHFTGWSVGARFYPVLYFLTRVGEARDWGLGVPLRANMLGKMNRLEVHHIFPKAQLYKRGFKRPEVNALANFCFQTKSTNLNISDRLPEHYFPEIEAAHPGALDSQWIPKDPALWKVERFHDFLEARKALLAEELNRRLAELLHGDMTWLAQAASVPPAPPVVAGGITSEGEEAELAAINDWVVAQGLPRGELSYDHADPETGAPAAIFDLAWPNGLQEELSQPVALLLNEEAATITLASQAGYRCFTDGKAFRRYVEREVLGEALVGV
jgi:hypothetical protein